MKQSQIKIEDFYGENCLSDDKRPSGYVEIFEIKNKEEKQLVGKHNLVLYTGREWLGSRIFNVQNSSISATPSEFIAWLGLGDQGTPISDPLNPTPPTNDDTGLNNDIMINATDSTDGDYRLSPVVGYYKHPIDSVVYEQDSNNSNAYLICKVTTTIGPNDANGYDLSEAGLFTAVDQDGPFHIYSRVTFPTIVKDSSRILTFVWFIYV